MPEAEVWESTVGKIIILYREYKHTWDFEEKLRRKNMYYSDLDKITPYKEKIVGW
jgi:hypothetical protein